MTAHDATEATPQPTASGLYKAVPPQVDLPAMERDILDLWEANGTVSYTHLDGYKRQPTRSSRCSRACGRSSRTCAACRCATAATRSTRNTATSD